MYEKLREFELRLPRKEVEEVDALRENWFELMELAEQVREVLLKERRGAFEQELDKQVKVAKNIHVYKKTNCNYFNSFSVSVFCFRSCNPTHAMFSLEVTIRYMSQ